MAVYEDVGGKAGGLARIRYPRDCGNLSSLRDIGNHMSKADSYLFGRTGQHQVLSSVKLGGKSLFPGDS